MFALSYDEMPIIHHRIFEHEIKMYPNDKHVRQCLRMMNPRKAPAIKAKTKKSLKARFIYPYLLTEWASNPIYVNKKHGPSVCVII